MELSNEWESIDEYSERLAVPGGWLIRSWLSGYQHGAAMAQTFIADVNHEWVLVDPEGEK